jgi:hypothetical protein
VNLLGSIGCRLASSRLTELGELMTLRQMRHTKLSLAGEAGNWELPAYEIQELGEGHDDIVTYHPTHEESPVASILKCGLRNPTQSVARDNYQRRS